MANDGGVSLLKLVPPLLAGLVVGLLAAIYLYSVSK